MLYCYSLSVVTARSFEWLIDGKSTTKKEKHGNYSVKIHSEMYIAWHMKVHNEKQNTGYVKVIWKIQYKFADAKINYLTWWYLSRFIRHSSLNISYGKRRHIFCLIVLQTLISATSPRRVHARYVGENLRENS